jgi:hypothetical protein
LAKGRGKLAARDVIKVVVKSPAPKHPHSRGFYQVEENILYVPLYPGGRFYSYLDSPQAIFDVDNRGRVLFFQILTPRNRWIIQNGIKPPTGLNQADIRFLDFRATLPEMRVETSSNQSWLRFVFSEDGKTLSYSVAEDLIFEITSDSTLAAIWLTAIEADRAARAMAAWRKQIRDEFPQQNGEAHYIRVNIRQSPR